MTSSLKEKQKEKKALAIVKEGKRKKNICKSYRLFRSK